MRPIPQPPPRVQSQEPPSYLGEMLKHPTNINIGMASLAGAAVLAFPLGLAGAALPLIAFGAGEAIASMFVPASSRFRDYINRKRRLEQRQAFALHLQQQIGQLVPNSDAGWAIADRMSERAQALRDLLRNNPDVLTEADLAQVENAPTGYLALWLARLTVEERLNALQVGDLKRRLTQVGNRLDEQQQPDPTLLKAKADLEELIKRRERLVAKAAAQDAALLSLPDVVEEIYQSALTSSAGGDGTARLQDAVAKLHIEENLSANIEQELASQN